MADLGDRALEFCRSIGKTLARPLGAGTDGTVWQIVENTAIKVFERPENYRDELTCYLRFQSARVKSINGFAVPRLRAYEDSLLAIEMSIVEPPYLLDFGKVYIDRPPPYYHDKTIRRIALEERQELFEDRWQVVEGLLFELEKLGIYYVDAKPGNIRFAGD